MSFVATQVAEFQKLVGLRVVDWHGVEMALREWGPDGLPSFMEPSVPFLQLLVLHARLELDEQLEISTYQNNDNWGLMLTRLPSSSGFRADHEGIFRTRSLAELPSGSIDSVQVFRDFAGDIERINLVVAGSFLSLIAGEVYENPDGSLQVQVGGDESVLVQIGAGA
ncbi:hypothetical protein [Marinobacter sp. JSM 1782161]|uniref:hypothetical protein n=1 Tax=Marinobacter sp. JSM 1782161 TaxID=2685906 RepID=UPI0014037E4E|nr:hypothetical protein [Marinobacter sp. JSM 1782161]